MRQRVLTSLLAVSVLAVPAAFVLSRVTRLDRPQAVPLALLTFTLLQLALLPATNAISRRYEAEADWLALRATNDAQAFEGLIRKLTVAGLDDPDPPGWARLLFGTHPSPLDRIEVSRAAALQGGS